MRQCSFVKAKLSGLKPKKIADLLKKNPSPSAAEKIYKTI